MTENENHIRPVVRFVTGPPVRLSSDLSNMVFSSFPLTGTQVSPYSLFHPTLNSTVPRPVGRFRRDPCLSFLPPSSYPVTKRTFRDQVDPRLIGNSHCGLESYTHHVSRELSLTDRHVTSRVHQEIVL